MGDSPSDAAARGAGERLLYFVRHGQSTWNVEGRIQGQVSTPPLTDLGRRQAAQAARSLAEVGAVALLTSDALRARQTADIIGQTLGLVPRPRAALRERHWGALQGRADADAWAAAARWREDETLLDGEALHGGEPRQQIRSRLEELVRAEVRRPVPGPVVLVSHGDTIAVARNLFADADAGAEVGDIVGNGGIVCVRLQDAAWQDSTWEVSR